MLTQYKNLHGAILLVTYGRSGSTILQSLLQSIEGAHIAGENGGVLSDLYFASEIAKSSRRQHGRKSKPRKSPWYNADKINVSGFESQLVNAFVDNILSPPEDVRWIGFKEIRHNKLGNQLGGYLDFCRRVFPNSYIVFNSRLPESVANSSWWADKSKENVISMIQKMDHRFSEYTKKHPENAYHVQYEELVEDPNSLKPLFDLLKEEFCFETAKKILSEKLVH